ncbi:hypothetical protein PIB30_069157 [Stylosanthes scabra]|uniref:Uncharacterized protein n=1 Tax=Stylosanthes scabra TaxID=79078 RepID=A0ABU6YL93_9FABA|nr:hypothetical protein [Stylosanthes scabra]
MRSSHTILWRLGKRNRNLHPPNTFSHCRRRQFQQHSFHHFSFSRSLVFKPLGLASESAAEVLCRLSPTELRRCRPLPRADVVHYPGLCPVQSPSLQQPPEPVRRRSFGDFTSLSTLSIHLRRLTTVVFSRLKSYALVKSFHWSSICHPAISRSAPFAFCSPPTDVLRINVTKGYGKRNSSDDLRLSLSLFATKSGALKAIETMHNTILRGKRMYVEKARTRRDNKHVAKYGTRYQVMCESFSRDEFVQGEKVVHGRVWDPSVELVMFGRGEVGEHEVKTDITKEILDEWKIVEVEQCPIDVISKERDPLADITMLKYNEVDEDRVRFVHLEEVVNKSNFVKAKIDSSNEEFLSGQNSNWSESRSSDRTITWLCGGKGSLMERNE